MKVLIACEFSNTVAKEFRQLGHDVTSCDLLPNDECQDNHYQGDVFDIITDGWDMMIAFPPCTHLAVSGAKHFEQKRKDGRQQDGIDFFMAFTKTNIPKVCIENPVGIMSKIYRKPDQIINPWQFGDTYQKTTCLWLTGLPKLFHAKEVDLFNDKITHVGKGNFYISPQGKKLPSWYGDATDKAGKKIAYGSVEMKKVRSTTFPGIAKSMSEQWGKIA
jgi:hypothetical protein